MYQQDFFENTKEKYPNKIALDDHGKKYTYKFLSDSSNKIANLLISLSSEHNERVCILTKKNINLYSSILGVLKAGMCWVPLSEQFPTERLSHILRTTDAKILIIEKEYLRLIKKNILKKLFIILINEKRDIRKKNFYSKKNIEKFPKIKKKN